MQPSSEKTLVAYVHDAVVQEAGRVREQEIKAAVKNFETELRKSIANIACRVADFYSVERLDGNLVIHVKLEDQRKQNG